MITLKAYAKLNLSLAVTGKRSDGYHELDMIMQSISLYDSVTVEKADGIRVRMDADRVEEKCNTAYKAAQEYLEYTGQRGANINIRKRIPRMSGLGGASADAAAVLIGLDALYGTRLDKSILARLGQQVGADVPFALIGGTARAKGIGEIITPLKIKKPMYYTVVKPFKGVSTAECFKRYETSAHISIDTVEYAVILGDIGLFSRHADNALGIAALSIAPDILKAAGALKMAGAKAAFMTGSGSAMFAAFGTEEEARRTAQKIRGDFELIGAFAAVNTGVEIAGETNEHI